jgi:hypothetical protein
MECFGLSKSIFQGDLIEVPLEKHPKLAKPSVLRLGNFLVLTQRVSTKQHLN